MTKDDIKKASEQYANDVCRSPHYRWGQEQVAMADFMEGAYWRINSVWHEGSEPPKTDKGDLLIIVKDAFGKNVYVHQNAYYVLKYGCVRWAYIEDLILNTEE
jgi:hypothetical protein